MTLTAHLRSGTTTICYCWVVQRRDGQTVGFTDHDQPVTVEGVTCNATTGITTTTLSQSLGLEAGDMEVEGVIDNDLLTVDDLRGGKYDDARVTIYVVNWSDPSQFEALAHGVFGTVFDTDSGSFRTDFRSLVTKLGQPEGRTYQRTCQAKLGDSKCGVDLSSPLYTKTATVVSATAYSLTVDTVGGVADEWFTLGKLVTVEGYEVGIRAHTGTTVDLWQRLPVIPAAGETVTLVAGCKQDRGTCATKFNNILRFQGFPFIPGTDRLVAYPIRGQGDYSGGSLFNED